ncbi:MAG TPA: tetratricopeptide repeat protein [Candidatus Eisenbacteria bacterium]|nr:tetratricopeptide repeat protein [Candidatus Eisenbacteria bacterium]
MRSLRESLLAALVTSREMESPLVEACDDVPAAQPGTWTAKDRLAHIAHYREHGAAVLDACRAGAPPPADAEADLDQRNARMLAENQGLPASDVRDRAAASYDRLVRAVEHCSDEVLLMPRSAESQAPIWWLVSGCGWGHVGQHLAHWYRDRDDWPAAERAARRVHEIEMASFEDARQRAAATYNLGCFYATRGRRSEALALVEEALAQAGELREVARRDPELDSIRDLLALDA